MLTSRKATRLAWSHDHRAWTAVQSRNIVSTDESRFNIQYNDECVHVWQPRGIHFDENPMLQHDRWDSGSVMVWGDITLTQKSALIHVDGHLNSELCIHDIFEWVAIPFGLQAAA